MNNLKFAVIGVGALGRHHARILSNMDGIDLIAVADPNEQQGRSVAESCGCEWIDDYRTLLQRVDAASIVVPTSIHRRVACDFLSRSIPVLVEKPLAATVEDGATMVNLAAEHRIPLQVGHVERFNPAFEELAGLAGSPRYIRAERVSPYAFRSMDIGVVHDLMIHDIDLVLRLTGSNVKHVDAFGICIVGGQEDCVQARLTFENGCRADLVANRVSPAASRKIQAWSEGGCVDADLHQRKVIAFQPGEALRAGILPFDLALQPNADIARLKEQVFGRFIETHEAEASDADALTAELSSFADAVRVNGTPAVDGVQGLAALEVAERVIACVREHSWDGEAGSRIGPHAHQIAAATREAA